MNMLFKVVLIFCLTISYIRADCQHLSNWGELEISRVYALGDMHLDQIRTKSVIENHKSVVDSSAHIEYTLLRYLVFERDVNYIFVELPVNFQLYLNIFLETGEFGELLKVFPSEDRHIHAKFNYLRQLKAERPQLKILCAEPGSTEQSLFYTANLFFQITKQVLGSDTARIDIEWNYPLYTELYREYSRQIDSLFNVNQDARLYELMKILVKKRFKGSRRPEREILEVSQAWLSFLKDDTEAGKYFSERDHLIEMIEWYMKGAKHGNRKLEKMRDRLLTEFVLEKIAGDTSAAILLFGNAHLSTSWPHSKNITFLLEEKGFQPVVVEICYRAYPYYFYPKELERKIKAIDQDKRLLRLRNRSWSLIIN